MIITVLGQLTPEDLARYRIADAKIDTAKIMPGAYGRAEIEEAYVRWYALRGEFQRTYDLPVDGQWNIALSTGAVVKDD